MDIVERYEQLTKQAALPAWAINAIIGTARKPAYDAFFDKSDYAPGTARYNPAYWGNRALSGLGSARDYVYGTMNPFKTEGTASYHLGKNIADFFLPKVYDPDDLGPYEEYSAYLKETEKAEMLLREAEKMRRRARLEELKQEQEEKNKAHASKS